MRHPAARMAQICRLPLTLFLAGLIPAATLALATPAEAAATYHPGAYSWHYVYLPDNSYQGADLNQADYYMWSDGTESVSNMYAGISRSSNNAGTTMIWSNAWLYNYDGTVPLYVYWARNDCGLGCYWSQNMWSGWKTVQAQSHYGITVHGIYGGCCRYYAEPTMGLWWP
jgi:hypothetical protein